MQIHPVSASEHLMFLTVRIIALDSAGSVMAVGTAFYFLFGPQSSKGIGWLCLVTNKHVLEESEEIDGKTYVTKVAERVQFNIHVDAADGTRHANYPVSIPLKGCRYDHPDVDLSVIHIDHVYAAVKQQGFTPFLRVFNESDIESDADLAEGLPGANNTIMAGYPIDLFDSLNNYPLFRKGITAIHPAIDFDNAPLGLLDIACWPGSSGSPVLILNEPLRKQTGMGHSDTRRIFLGVVCANYCDTIESKIEKRKIATKRDMSFALPAHAPLHVKAKALLAFAKRKIATQRDLSVPAHVALYVKAKALLAFAGLFGRQHRLDETRR